MVSVQELAELQRDYDLSLRLECVEVGMSFTAISPIYGRLHQYMQMYTTQDLAGLGLLMHLRHFCEKAVAEFEIIGDQKRQRAE